MDGMNSNEQENLWKLLATAIYSTATPFSIVENDYWIQNFKGLRPSFIPPSRHLISNKLLDDEYIQMSTNVNKKVHEAFVFRIQIDGWSNIRNEPIMNIIITTPEPVV
ncbi:uncharacterized protein LOC112689689 [Sipha flava]|uniref:Uncharacterized protein LOC112689689 n=2 Tax=Sipha flava TaxID=143950 RepID=A0A8B8G7V4_9HEMI|nr:uncharacterized protein LOC112689689 [Sipha flava]